MKKAIKYVINGDEWDISVLDKKTYSKKHGNDSYAITEIEQHYIDFTADAFCIELVLHELFHAHISYCYIETATLKQGQMEEVACELFAYRGNLINKQAKEIFKKLTK
jgi:hypothetical protein